MRSQVGTAPQSGRGKMSQSMALARADATHYRAISSGVLPRKPTNGLRLPPPHILVCGTPPILFPRYTNELPKHRISGCDVLAIRALFLAPQRGESLH